MEFQHQQRHPHDANVLAAIGDKLKTIETNEFKIGIDNIYDIIPNHDGGHFYCDEFELIQRDVMKLFNLFREIIKVFTFQYNK